MKYWVVILALSLVACNVPSTPLPLSTETLIPPNWWDSWLAQPACKLLCWQNITPGVTTMKEAISILENLPELTITFKSEDGADWVFNENKDEGGTLGASDAGVVDIIWLGSVSDTKLHLATVVASYDAPEYVKPYDCREGMCSTALIYPDLGMFLSIFIENAGTINNPQFEILPDAIIDRVYFIEQGMNNFQNRITFQDYDLLTDWKGYGEYP
jgi:hypothetical protein